MNIGFVSTWLQRGAAYVTINYIKLVEQEHNVFIYGRGGEFFDKEFKIENISIEMGYRLEGTRINVRNFSKWVKKYNLEMVIFNEQSELASLCEVRKLFPKVIFGTYIDYYKENTIKNFGIYDFLICNTKRHYSVFDWHQQCLYLPWGVDTELFIPQREKKEKEFTFFHSMGMSNRKGTEELIEAFIRSRLGEQGAKLVIHTQVNIDHLIDKTKAKKNNIKIIHKTVEAPGLYFLGDMYVYPAKLDGLGLTIYEALSCGLPVITTDVPPMNEAVNETNGRLIKVKKTYCRSDGYYWPMSVVDVDDLANVMIKCFEQRNEIRELSSYARQFAVENLNLRDRKVELLRFLREVRRIDNSTLCDELMINTKKQKRSKKMHNIVCFLPDGIESKIRERIEARRRKGM